MFWGIAWSLLVLPFVIRVYPTIFVRFHHALKRERVVSVMITSRLVPCLLDDLQLSREKCEIDCQFKRSAFSSSDIECCLPIPSIESIQGPDSSNFHSLSDQRYPMGGGISSLGIKGSAPVIFVHGLRSARSSYIGYSISLST